MQPVTMNYFDISLIIDLPAACYFEVLLKGKNSASLLSVEKPYWKDLVLHTWWYRTIKEHVTDLVHGLRPLYHEHELLATVPYNADCYDLQSFGKIFVRILPELLNQLFAAWNCHFRTHLRHNYYHSDRAHVFPPCWIWNYCLPTMLLVHLAPAFDRNAQRWHGGKFWTQRPIADSWFFVHFKTWNLVPFFADSAS